MFLLSTDSLRGYGLSRIFGFAQEVGFNGMEVALDIRQFDTQNAEYLDELQKKYKLPIRVVRSFPNSTIRQAILALDIAKALNSNVVVLEPPRLFDFKYKDWMKKQVPSLRKKYGLSIALKNGPSETMWGFLPGRAMNSIPDLQNFKEVCLDVSNLYAKKIDLMRAHEMVKKFMVHVHLSNVFHGMEHSLLDDGIMPLESFLTKLQKEDYKGDISLLLRPKVLMAGDDKKMIKNLEKQLRFFHKYMD